MEDVQGRAEIERDVAYAPEQSLPELMRRRRPERWQRPAGLVVPVLQSRFKTVGTAGSTSMEQGYCGSKARRDLLQTVRGLRSRRRIE
jgi:hypothetical protein